MAVNDSRQHDLLIRYVADADVPCPGCGYNLRGLSSSNCPECGQELKLTVGLAEPKQAALIAGLIGLSAGCGLSGLLLIYAAIVIFVMKRGPMSMLDKFIVINAIGLAAHGGVLLGWVKNWNRIRRAPRMRRWMMVVFCWLMPLSYVVIFAAKIK